MKRIVFLCTISFFLSAAFANAEENITVSNEGAKNNIANFDKNWAVNFLMNYNMGIFGGINADEYRTDKPFDIGFGIRYKNISALASVSVSFLDSSDIKAFDFSLDSYFDNVYYKAYFKRYPNLYDFNNEKNIELDIHSSGIMASFVHNNENHSVSSVVKLDKQQTVSSGSLLYGLGVFHSSLYSPSETMKKYNDRQHISAPALAIPIHGYLKKAFL